VVEHPERDDRVERCVGERDRGQVALQEREVRLAFSGHRQLTGGQIHACVRAPVRERGGRGAGAATQLQDGRAGRQPLENLVEEPRANLVAAGIPLCVASSDPVITVRDDPFGIQPRSSPNDAGACSLTRCPRCCNG
jgi:hypothetical protein